MAQALRVRVPPLALIKMPKPKLPAIDFEWTSQLAYVIGLLVTDGNLSSDGRHIVMRSAEKDQLNTFKQCLGINNKIGFTEGQRGYRVQFGNIQFYNWLMSIGLFPAKSYTIGEIKVPDEFFRDYFRGCIDGDGNIQTYEDGYNSYRGRQYFTQRLFIRIVSASEKHILWLREKIKFFTGLHGSINKRKPKDNKHVPIWELKFAKKESLQLIKWIYYDKNIPYLKRKRDIAEQAVEIISKQKRRVHARV